jgi:hypothetical protein
MFDTPFSTDTTADLVFGQLGSFTTNNPNINGVNADTLEIPTDIEGDIAGNVYISDTGTERTLIYDTPAVFGTTADVVFGQGGSMTSFGNNQGGISADSQADPWAIALDGACNLWTVDYGNNRVLEYDKPPHACVEQPFPTGTPPPAPTPPPLNTAPGTTISVSLNGGTSHARGVEIVFQEVTSAGQTTVSTSESGPPPPPGYNVEGVHGHGPINEILPVPPTYYDLNTTAGIAGLHSVCISYDASQATDEGALRLMHYELAAWVDITTIVRAHDDVVCGQTASLSPFAIMEPPSSVGGIADLTTVSRGSGNGLSPPARGAVYLLLLAGALAAVVFGRGLSRRR